MALGETSDQERIKKKKRREVTRNSWTEKKTELDPTLDLTEGNKGTTRFSMK